MIYVRTIIFMIFLLCAQGSIICMKEATDKVTDEDKKNFVPYGISYLKECEHHAQNKPNKQNTKDIGINNLFSLLTEYFDGSRDIRYCPEPERQRVHISYAVVPADFKKNNIKNYESVLNVEDESKKDNTYYYQMLFLAGCNSFHDHKKSPRLILGSRMIGLSCLGIVGWQLYKNGLNKDLFNTLDTKAKIGLVASSALYIITRMCRLYKTQKMSPLNRRFLKIGKQIGLSTHDIEQPKDAFTKLYKANFCNSNANDSTESKKKNSSPSIIRTIITTITTLLSYF